MRLTPAALRGATWRPVPLPVVDPGEFRVWSNDVAPEITRVAASGRLYFRFMRRDYSGVEAVTKAYNDAEKAKDRAAPESVQELHQKRAKL